MMNSWLSRLCASVAAVSLCGGLVFLSGCCDEDCEHEVEVSCGEPNCEDVVHDVSYGPVEYGTTETTVGGGSQSVGGETHFGESRGEFNRDVSVEPGFDRSMDRSFDTSAGAPRWSDSEIRMKRDRLIEIERERSMYPDRAERLDMESARLNRELNEVNVNVYDNRDRSFESRDVDHHKTNINVYDRGMDRQDSVRSSHDVNVNVDKPAVREEQGAVRSDDDKAQDISVRGGRDASRGAEFNTGLRSDVDLERDRSIRAREIQRPGLSEQRLRTESEQRAGKVNQQSEIDFNARPNRDVRLENRSDVRSDVQSSPNFQRGIDNRSATTASDVDQQNTSLQSPTTPDATTGVSTPSAPSASVQSSTDASALPREPVGTTDADAQFNADAPNLNPSADATNSATQAQDAGTGVPNAQPSFNQPTSSQTTVTPGGTVSSQVSPQTGASTSVDVSGPTSQAGPSATPTPPSSTPSSGSNP
ncbi:MAG TPA: hypothetical protein VEK08_07225 [Planctomycetota bacterium]|nr:hypothetical protein [Planctomycetota bacterium]